MLVSRYSRIHPHTPPRVEVRPASRADVLTQSRGLTAPDAEVISYLARHRVLTALQLARLVFVSYSHARSRLAVLHERGVLARFRRDIWPGSQPWRYALGPVGAVVHAAATGAALPRPATVAENVLRLAHSAHTEHRLGVNDFFATLAGRARHDPDCALDEWWPESEIGETCAGIVRPDAYGKYTDHDHTLSFFYEHDTGTETIETLVEKVGKYAELADAGIRKPILFQLPSTNRETTSTSPSHKGGRTRHPYPWRPCPPTSLPLPASASCPPLRPSWTPCGYLSATHAAAGSPTSRRETRGRQLIWRQHDLNHLMFLGPRTCSGPASNAHPSRHQRDWKRDSETTTRQRDTSSRPVSARSRSLSRSTEGINVRNLTPHSR